MPLRREKHFVLTKIMVMFEIIVFWKFFHIRGIQLKKPPLFKKPPLVTPRSATRGGFLKRCHFFLDFAVFSFENRSKNTVFARKFAFRATPNRQNFRLRRAVNPPCTIIDCLQYRYGTESCHWRKKQKFWKHLQRSETLWNVQKAGLSAAGGVFFWTFLRNPPCRVWTARCGFLEFQGESPDSGDLIRSVIFQICCFKLWHVQTREIHHPKFELIQIRKYQGK